MGIEFARPGSPISGGWIGRLNYSPVSLHVAVHATSVEAQYKR